MFIQNESLTPQQLYPLLVGGVTPRPIAWISTLSKEGVSNIAPYSFFSVASCNPPVLWYTQVTPRDGNDKDTLRNLIDTQECVIHIVDTSLIEKMNLSCATLPANQSEFDFAAIESCASVCVRAPSVKAALVRYECRLREVVRVSSLPSGGSSVLLDVVAVYVDDSIYKNGQIQADLLQSVGKLGADFYAINPALRELARP